MWSLSTRGIASRQGNEEKTEEGKEGLGGGGCLPRVEWWWCYAELGRGGEERMCEKKATRVEGRPGVVYAEVEKEGGSSVILHR